MNALEIEIRMGNAKYPEDIFGDIKDITELNGLFRKWSRLVHPDVNGNDAKFVSLFQQLNEWKELAEQKFTSKTYGITNMLIEPIVVNLKKGIYTLTTIIGEGDISVMYSGKNKSGETVFVKIVNSPVDNALIANEYDRLVFLWTAAKTKELTVMQHICPKPLETFSINIAGQRRAAIAFANRPDMIPLSDIIKAYPNGIDLRDAAWMFNRLLGALMIPYQAPLIHGAVVPDNVLVNIQSHNGCLIDWAFAVTPGKIITDISGTYSGYYPQEVLKKEPAHKSIDLYMASMCFLKLLGGDVGKKTIPDHVPDSIKNLLRACWLPAKRRTCDPFEMFEDLKQALEVLYGKPKFRVFSMPSKK